MTVKGADYAISDARERVVAVRVGRRAVMDDRPLRRRMLMRSSALVALLASFSLASPARAQVGGVDPASGDATDTTDEADRTPAKTPAPAAAKTEGDTRLKASDGDIVVTGSLIPVEKAILPVPTLSLNAQDIQARGFTSVADAIQQSPFSTGGVQGAGSGYSQGARTARLFGFGPGFTKYLLDGRPMGMFPALYGSQAAFVDLSTIPTQLVERVDILPGGQSSLYGSDAIAGVVNIVLRKKLDAPIIDARLGLTDRGGGRSWRVSGADSVSRGPATLLFGAQYEDIQPIWGYQRELTATPFRSGTSAPVPVQFASLYDAYTYRTLQLPATACTQITSLYNSGISYYDDPAAGAYCGNSNTGYTTMSNKEKRLNLYAHTTVDLGDTMSFYADFLYGHADTRFTNALNTSYYDSRVANSPYFVSSLGRPAFIIRGFSPEELGGTDALLSRQSTSTLFANLGLRGSIGDTPWNYDVTYSRNQQDLTLRRRAIYAAPIERYFASVLGTRTGTYRDSFYGLLSTYTDLAGAFAPIPASAVASFYGFATSRARTNSNWGRGLLSNGHLFALAGGDAGIALAVEGGDESWKYVPDAGFLNKTYYGGLTDISGNGTRSYIAATGELRLPVRTYLTLSGSARYDRYFIGDGIQTGRASFNVAGELTPFRMLTLRARYGTAFKAPTLADLYQGESTQLGYAVDYGRCVAAAGGSASAVTNCGIGGTFLLRLSGNRALQSITANVADLGGVFQPTPEVSLSVDYLRWRVDNGVSTQNFDTILRDEALCRSTSNTVDAARCTEVRSYVGRSALGILTSVYTPKINITRARRASLVSVLSASHSYDGFGQVNVSASYTLLLENKTQSSPQSRVIDLLANPLTSSDFKTRGNISVGWLLDRVSLNAYVDRLGRTPNYIARTLGVAAKGAALISPLGLLNVSAGYRLTPRLQLSLNVNNVMDADPPADYSYPGTVTGAYNSFNYNLVGRSFLMQVSAKL